MNAPTLGLGVDDLVDWLELVALFDEFGVARLDALLGSLAELEPSAEDDIGRRDQEREQLVEMIEAEVTFRQTNLEDAYPFELSGAADEMLLSPTWREEPRLAFYLVCLVATHASGSPILRAVPVDEMLRELRNKIFQVVATLGLAGLSRGPAFSVGWPRQNGERIVELLTRAVAAGGGFTVRDPPSPYTPPHEKDGGVDVIAFTLDGRPPPVAFYFGQTASGRNWEDKPVGVYVDTFVGAYMLDHRGNPIQVTLIPHRVLDEARWSLMSHRHKAILDRSRLPLRAWQGLQLANSGVPVDGADLVGDLQQWLLGYYNYAQAA
jgi:hypothetical protein